MPCDVDRELEYASNKPPAMFIEVLLVVALPLLGTFVIALLRKVVDGEPLDLRFGNDAALEMIVLSLGGLAGAAHNPRLMANWGRGDADLAEPLFSCGYGIGGVLVLPAKVRAGPELAGRVARAGCGCPRCFHSD